MMLRINSSDPIVSILTRVKFITSAMAGIENSFGVHGVCSQSNKGIIS